MRDLSLRLQEADALLAPYAVQNSSGLGRSQPETEDASRFRFQRDRGRIVHTEAFRRLKGKTQVFVGGGGDHYRTRLTHTMEVAGISRDIARTLSLNEDLAECIALAHDLGHPPFGHAGEAALNEWMQKQNSGFEHNLQSYRIVTLLEKHASDTDGLNLNREILEGLLKHRTPHDKPDGSEVSRSPSLEAQIVNLADEIAYTAHDCEDGLKAELFFREDLLAIALAKEADQSAEKRQTSLRGSIIGILVNDLYKAAEESLSSHRINTLDQVYAAEETLIEFSISVRSELDALRTFLYDRMYNHPVVLERSHAGQHIITSLCDHYSKQPNEKINQLAERTGDAVPEAVKDYVAGMTDGYAYLQASELKVLDSDTSSVLGK